MSKKVSKEDLFRRVFRILQEQGWPPKEGKDCEVVFYHRPLQTSAWNPPKEEP
jgi:hypothetical protein